MRASIVVLAACAPPAVPARVVVAPAVPAPAIAEVDEAALHPAVGMPREPPPTATLAAGGTLYVIETDPARCEAWTVEAAEPWGRGRLVRRDDNATLSMEVISRGRALTIEDARREVSNDNWVTSTCSAELQTTEFDDALGVDGARWFRDAKGCADALARHRRVAMAWPCLPDAFPDAAARAAGRARLDRMLVRGGRVYADVSDRCVEVRVDPEGKPDAEHRIRGSIGYAMTRDDGVKGRESYTYEHHLGTDEVTMLGPGWHYEDGSAGALGCGGIDHADYRGDAIVLGQELYPTVAACKAAIGRERERTAWLPATEPEDEADAVASQGASPSLGGC